VRPGRVGQAKQLIRAQAAEDHAAGLGSTPENLAAFAA
jgi:hypothetical protein